MTPQPQRDHSIRGGKTLAMVDELAKWCRDAEQKTGVTPKLVIDHDMKEGVIACFDEGTDSPYVRVHPGTWTPVMQEIWDREARSFMP